MSVKLSHKLEYVASRAVAGTFGMLPLGASTSATAAVARSLGMLTYRRRAERNLAYAMPELSAGERAAILREMFDNLTRTAVEYCHLDRIAAEPERIAVEGAEYLAAAQASGKGAVLVTGHFGNWEVIRIASARLGWPSALIYRAFNNPLFDNYARRLMGVTDAPIWHKGKRGSLGLLRHVRGGGAALILTDQRFAGAPHLPFFGKPARTALAAAEIAQNYDAALIPVRGERLGRSSRFRVVFEAPLPVVDRSAEEVMTAINARIEDWVRAQPSQYFWLHNRWGKGVSDTSG